MRLKLYPAVLFLTLNALHGQTPYQKDFEFYWQTINYNFAYFYKQHADWNKVKTLYQPAVDTITTRDSFIHLLENVNNELYNGHIFLNVNTNSSPRTIPTGADLEVSCQGNRFVISGIREGYNSDLCGLKTGMVVTRFNQVPMEDAIMKFLPKSVTSYDTAMLDYAANLLLAGTHNTQREITVLVNKQEQTFRPDQIPNKTEEQPETLIESRILADHTGYIKINNSLGNTDLIRAFDQALDSLLDSPSLILDLRETPSGGTTTIARAIMGRFTDRELPYQKHIYTSEEKETGIRRSTLELVSPRGKIYTGHLVVLVGYWTGSMGEGMAIGFDGMKKATIMGTKMAGLLGEIYSFETPESKIKFSFPCVQLQHINGQPREDFNPVPMSEGVRRSISQKILPAK
jgi:C-terminal processing protease CtpA/Prc